MSAVYPSLSGGFSSKLADSKGSQRSKSAAARFHATTQARFGYLGHLSLRDAQDNADALRNVSALDGHSFMPHVMTMQRASTPWQFNTPSRLFEDPVPTSHDAVDPDTGEELPSHPSVDKSATKKKLMLSEPLPANYVRRVRRRAQKSMQNSVQDYRTQIADLRLLVDAASRSGNVYQALQAYHKMGIVFDNQGMFAEAIQKYKQFLSLCITSKNTQGEALAYNCLGIDCFKLKQYDEAIQYHNKHLELADSTGRLIAHTNLGIVFQAMGLAEHAAIHHQHAIEYANRMGAKDAQCFTVGNLGIASAANGDLPTSKICLQYHLNAAHRQKQMLGDTRFAHQTLQTVANTTHHRLGQVHATDGKMDDAALHFEQAIKVAKSKGDLKSEETSSALFGVAKGLADFDSHVQALMARATSETPALAEP